MLKQTIQINVFNFLNFSSIFKNILKNASFSRLTNYYDRKDKYRQVSGEAR